MERSEKQIEMVKEIVENQIKTLEVIIENKLMPQEYIDLHVKFVEKLYFANGLLLDVLNEK